MVADKINGGGVSDKLPQKGCTVCSTPSLLPRILSGSVGSLVTALAVTPLEVVKIRQQSAGSQPAVQPNQLRVEPCPRGCGGTIVLNNGLMECVLPKTSVFSDAAAAPQPPPTRFSASVFEPKSGGTIHTLMSIFRNEGWEGLYAGLRPTLVMSVPNTVLYFTAYDEISSRLRQNHNNHLSSRTLSNERCENVTKKQAYIPLVAGSSARLLASLATAPLELMRTRQAGIVNNGRSTGSLSSSGTFEEIRVMLRTHGVSSLYVGLGPTLWRDVPFSAIYWLCLERFKTALSESNDLGQWGGQYHLDRGNNIPPSLQAMHAFMSGAAAGAIAAAFTTPFDVVKTRRQMVSGQIETTIPVGTCDYSGCGTLSGSQIFKDNRFSAVGYGRVNLGTFGHMNQIIQHEGLSGLWKGNTTRMVKVAPACAIMISCYELGKRVFEDALES
mmetsp:Transcript_7104/g.15318  ORF Transcript_7104/g.15318 Transcript_7104/m.15318 type:complete len:442 (-) Transcript_7104:24-1349(-)